MLAMAFAMAWLVGGFLGAEWLAKIWPGPSIRQQGSGNPGASNALRVRGKVFAALVLAWDVAKAVVAVWALPLLVLRFDAQADIALMQFLFGLAVVAGHLWPMQYGLKGGKGVATALGVLLCVVPALVPWVLGVWLTLFLTTGYSGLASAVAALVLPLWAVTTGDAESGKALMACSMRLAALVLGAHRQNLQRLLRGEESQFALPWLKRDG